MISALRFSQETKEDPEGQLKSPKWLDYYLVAKVLSKPLGAGLSLSKPERLSSKN